MKFNGYIAFVESQPILGIPSTRIYGPFENEAAGWRELVNMGAVIVMGSNQRQMANGWHRVGVLPLRPVETLKDERP